MSYLLCHHCLCWVEPFENWCPECYLEIDPHEPDPEIGDLARILGIPVQLLGEVRVRRRRLPDRGFLYETSGGLFFVPHEYGRVPVASLRSDPAHDAIWTLVGFAFFPIAIARALMGSGSSSGRSPGYEQVTRPRYLLDAGAEQMSQLLMSDPGVFFVRKQAIQIIRRRFSNWVIERIHGPAVRFSPVDDPTGFRARMHQLGHGDHI